jgi:hypothetical protein
VAVETAVLALELLQLAVLPILVAVEVVVVGNQGLAIMLALLAVLV